MSEGKRTGWYLRRITFGFTEYAIQIWKESTFVSICRNWIAVDDSWKTEKLVSSSRTSVSQNGMKMFWSVLSLDVFSVFPQNFLKRCPSMVNGLWIKWRPVFRRTFPFIQNHISFRNSSISLISREIGRKEKFQRISPRIVHSRDVLDLKWVDSFEGIDAESGYRGGRVSPFGNTKL